MNVVQVKQLVVGPFATNCYIVYGMTSRQGVVIDPGGDAKVIFDFLLDNQVKPLAIFLTHGHIDHLLALPELIKQFDMGIYAHVAEQAMLAEVGLQAQMFGLKDVQQPQVNHWLQDNDQINLDGLKFGVLHTPGHSPGGCCFQLPTAIFVGDTLFAASIGRTDLPGGNYRTLIQSIQNRLMVLPDDTVVYPGHGETTTIGEERNYNPFLTTN